MRTNINLLIELQEFLTNQGYDVYIDRLPKEENRIGEDGALMPYIVISSTPANLLRSDKRAAGDKYATRTGNVKVYCMAGTKIEAGQLASEVDGLLISDNNAGWACSDGIPLEPYSSWSYDSVNTNSEQDVFISTLNYRYQKNIAKKVV
ncbi:MAG: hypothetical protein LBT91_02740 [Bifidobacteriaceae bacterium]|jgi:hypothetical protein|nr:hypothetical protein [Bifidobacteriaceae bacterium]